MLKLLLEKNVKLIVSDFDGVMTDNRALIDEEGKEYVFVNRSDGLGIKLLRDEGVEVIILSTERNPVVSMRARKLNVECVQGALNKEDALKEISRKKNVNLDRVAYIGNDINDLSAMSLAGVKIAPVDAYSEIKCIADYVTTVKGGYGVIREIAENEF